MEKQTNMHQIDDINKIIENAKKSGIDLKINKDLFTKDHLDILWFGGDIAEFDYKDYTIYISAYGDVIADLYINHKLMVYVKDEANDAEFYNEMHEYLDDKDLANDKITLFAFVNDGIIQEKDKVLFLNANNWLEFNIFNKKTNKMWDLIETNILDGPEDSDVLLSLDDLSFYTDFIENNKNIYD